MGLKILLLSHSFHPDVGGIETISEFLADAFYKAGHEVHVLTWSEGASKTEFPYPITRNPTKLTLFRKFGWADVVFENNPCLQLSWPGMFFRKPLVVSLHTWIARMDGTVSWVDKLKLKKLGKAQKVISCSQAVSARCWPASLVIQNPYREQVFKTLAGVAKEHDFIFLGRLVSDKGANIAIDALHTLSEAAQGKKPTLTIVGDGPERQHLETMVADRGLQQQVQFTGTLNGEALVQTLNQHRFLLVPSVWDEPFGLVALEGMACGCVPIVADGGGLPEAVGPAGLTFQKGNVSALVAAINKIRTHPELELQLRSAADTHLSKHRSSVIAAQYLAVVEDTAKSRP